jgi:hypothetical protein
MAGKTAWLIVDAAQTPMGAVTDSIIVDPVTLAPVTRTVHQGPATIRITARGDSLVGRIEAGPQQLPIAVKAEPPVYMEAGALNVALSTLPLAPGFRGTYRVFDILGASTKEHLLEVAGSETVSVPAGTFETFRVEARPVDGSAGGATLWIETAPAHRLVKSEATLPPQMGGARVVAQLTN